MTVSWYQSLIKVLLSRFPQSCRHFQSPDLGTQYLVSLIGPTLKGKPAEIFTGYNRTIQGTQPYQTSFALRCVLLGLDHTNSL